MLILTAENELEVMAINRYLHRIMIPSATIDVIVKTPREWVGHYIVVNFSLIGRMPCFPTFSHIDQSYSPGIHAGEWDFLHTQVYVHTHTRSAPLVIHLMAMALFYVSMMSAQSNRFVAATTIVKVLYKICMRKKEKYKTVAVAAMVFTTTIHDSKKHTDMPPTLRCLFEFV